MPDGFKVFWISIMFIENTENAELKKYPLVSLIIPVLNEEKSIKNTVDSF